VKSLVLYSGGLDSTVLLLSRLAQDDDVAALSVWYGQRHGIRELAAAAKLCTRYGVHRFEVNLDTVGRLLGGSALTDDRVDVPEGHYEDESMKTTIVPNRNMMMLSVAASIAMAGGFDRVVYGPHAGDRAIYPDCRQEFIVQLNQALALADERQVHVVAPFVEMSKADIVRRGVTLGVPFAETWSCYKGGDVHCGACGTCVERREAFELAGVTDPTVYA